MIEVSGLRYAYPGAKKPAVDGLEFSVSSGEIFGFLGPSGAGKSTTQKVLIGLLRSYAGSAKVLGRELKTASRDLYEDIGVAFEFPHFYAKLTAEENLRLFASLYDGRRPIDPRPILERLGLLPDLRKKVSDYSKGMKMRLNFCRALMHDPAVLFLDEPTSGLDPANARILKDMVLEAKGAGKAVFLTTHDMHLAEELCDRLAFIVNGTLVLLDDPRSLKLRYGKNTVRVEYETSEGLGAATFDLESLGRDEAFTDLLKAAKIRTIHSEEADLESIFIRTTGRSLL